MVRKYQPRAVINPRSGWEGDFQCDEGGHEIRGPIIDVPWEKCLNLNQVSWGYCQKQNLMTPEEIVRMLVNVVGRGGNVLLNVGPDPDGIIPSAHIDTLNKVGDWLRHHGKSIFGTKAGPFQPVDGIYCSTCSGNSIYLHVFDWGKKGSLVLPSQGLKIKSYSLLSGDELSCIQTDTQMELTVSAKKNTGFPDVVELVI
jgi:alpha-L-fucosidase